MTEIITCPTGLTGRIRSMTVREERILPHRRLAKSGGQLDELLGSCWEEILTTGRTCSARAASSTGARCFRATDSSRS